MKNRPDTSAGRRHHALIIERRFDKTNPALLKIRRRASPKDHHRPAGPQKTLDESTP
jgi:hypothetical protein